MAEIAVQAHMDDGSEEVLIARSRAGDVEPFNQLVLRYQEIVYNVACRMTNDRDAAADVAQETFITAYKAIRGFRGGSFRAWILRIASNKCLDYLRQRRRHIVTSLESVVASGDCAMEPVEARLRPEEAVLRRELIEHIQAGLLALPPDQRLILVLVDVHGLSYEEAGRIADCSLGTVKSRLSRGRARLKDYLLARGTLPFGPSS